MRSSRALLLAAAVSVVSFGGSPARSGVLDVTELSGPGDFTGATTLIDFDDAADGDAANTRYSAQGVTFSNCDPLTCTSAPVPIIDLLAADPPRVPHSDPNVIATEADYPEGSGSEFSDFLDLLFDTPTLELGAWFGNDQGIQPTLAMQLSVFDAGGALIGSVLVDANSNTSVDQFAGLRTNTTPFRRARFEWVGAVPAISVHLDDVEFTAVPEPSSLTLLCVGLGALAYRRRRK